MQPIVAPRRCSHRATGRDPKPDAGRLDRCGACRRRQAETVTDWS